MIQSKQPAPADAAVSEVQWFPIISLAFVVMTLITSEFLPVSLLTPIAQDLHVSEGTAG